MQTSTHRPFPDYNEGNKAIRFVLIALLVLGLAVSAVVRLLRGPAESCEDPFIRDIQQTCAAIRRDPSDVAAHLKRAAAYRELGKFDKAAADFSRAITLGATNDDAFLTRAKCFNVIGRNQAALEDIHHVLESSPPSERSCHLQADTYSDMGNYDESLAAFAEGLKLDPTNAPLLICQARVFRKMGDLDAAERGFNEAIALDPQDAYAYNCRGQLYAEKGEHAKAVKDFTTALAAKPTCYLRRLWIGTYLSRSHSANAIGMKRYKLDLFMAAREIARQTAIDKKIQAAETAAPDVPRTKKAKRK